MAALDALVRERTAVVEAARRWLGPSFDATPHATPAIRRLVVTRALGAAHTAPRDDTHVAAAFDTLLALGAATTNPLAAHIAVGARDRAGSRDAALMARDTFLTHAWKGVTHPETR